MKKYKVEVDAVVKGQKDVDKLNDSLEETGQEQENINEGFNEMGGAADKATGGAVSGMIALKTSVMKSVKSLGIMKVAIAATGLGALLLIVASLKAAFTSSEEGQNKFSKIMNALGVITGNIIDLLAKFGGVIIDAFSNPVESIKALWEAIKSNIVVRINAVIDLFGLLGKAIGHVFKGEWSEAGEVAVLAGKKMVDAMTGVENSVDRAINGVKELIDETIREIGVSNRLSDLQAKIARREREQLVERAKMEGEISELKLKAVDTEKYTARERAVYLNEAMALNDRLFSQEQELARMRLEVRREQNKLSGSTKDDLLEEAQLEADLIRIIKQRADAKKEMFTQLIAAQREYRKSIAQLEGLSVETTELTTKERGAIIKKGGEGRIMTAENVAQEEAKIEKMSAQGTLNAVGGLFGMLADLSAADFERQKKFRIAEAVVSTLSGAVAAFMGGVSTIPGPFGIALGAILAGVTLAAGYANVNRIKASTPNSSGGGGGSMGGGSASAAIPRLSAPSQQQVSPMTTGEANIADAVSTNDKPLKAFVVSDDMTSQQALDRRIEVNAAV